MEVLQNSVQLCLRNNYHSQRGQTIKAMKIEEICDSETKSLNLETKFPIRDKKGMMAARAETRTLKKDWGARQTLWHGAKEDTDYIYTWGSRWKQGGQSGRWHKGGKVSDLKREQGYFSK